MWSNRYKTAPFCPFLGDFSDFTPYNRPLVERFYKKSLFEQLQLSESGVTQLPLRKKNSYGGNNLIWLARYVLNYLVWRVTPLYHL